MTISTHVLDTATGRPATALPVVLQRRTDDGWVQLAAGRTDADGRVADLLDGHPARAGVHRLVFDTGTYHERQGTVGFYPEVVVTFEVRVAADHHHVPLLLSPFGYSTYRGT